MGRLWGNGLVACVGMQVFPGLDIALQWCVWVVRCWLAGPELKGCLQLSKWGSLTVGCVWSLATDPDASWVCLMEASSQVGEGLFPLTSRWLSVFLVECGWVLSYVLRLC